MWIRLVLVFVVVLLIVFFIEREHKTKPVLMRVFSRTNSVKSENRPTVWLPILTNRGAAVCSGPGKSSG
jgi:hypothetical protein